MGFLDKKITGYYSLQKVTIKDIGDFLTEKLGEKYKVKQFDKGNLGKQMLSGRTEDQVLVEKNGYHRMVIALSDIPANQSESGKEEVMFRMGQAGLNGFLRFLRKETGLIGAGILKLIYGSGDDFYYEIINVLSEKYELVEREVNVGVSALFNKKKNK